MLFLVCIPSYLVNILNIIRKYGDFSDFIYNFVVAIKNIRRILKVMDTRIIILSDNRTDNPLLETEHGLSVYLENNGRRYLLDTGASDLFMRNAEKLGVDLSEVDYCLISHGHNDHIGGLPAFWR